MEYSYSTQGARVLPLVVLQKQNNARTLFIARCENTYTGGYKIGPRADTHRSRQAAGGYKTTPEPSRTARTQLHLRNPSAHRTWTRRRASSGHERLFSARRRPGASPRSNARRSASWRSWRSRLCLQTLRRHRLSRTAPGSRASRSRIRVELVGTSR